MGWRSLEVRAQVFKAGGAANDVLAAVFARVFMAGIVVDGVGAGVGARCRFFPDCDW